MPRNDGRVFRQEVSHPGQGIDRIAMTTFKKPWKRWRGRLDHVAHPQDLRLRPPDHRESVPSRNDGSHDFPIQYLCELDAAVSAAVADGRSVEDTLKAVGMSNYGE